MRGSNVFLGVMLTFAGVQLGNSTLTVPVSAQTKAPAAASCPSGDIWDPLTNTRRCKVPAIDGQNTDPPSSEEIRAKEVKAKAKRVPYESLARYPDRHVGTSVTFRGKVVQVQEERSGRTLRIDVTRGPYGLWKDTLYVEYKMARADEGRILDNDMVSVWGEFRGIMTYRAIMGNIVQIPHVVAHIIERHEEPKKRKN